MEAGKDVIVLLGLRAESLEMLEDVKRSKKCLVLVWAMMAIVCEEGEA